MQTIEVTSTPPRSQEKIEENKKQVLLQKVVNNEDSWEEIAKEIKVSGWGESLNGHKRNAHGSSDIPQTETNTASKWNSIYHN